MASKPTHSLTAPAPGHYLVRLVPRGWEVPALITLADGRYTAIVDGKPVLGSWTEQQLETAAVDAATEGELFNHPFLRLCLFGRRCDEAIYEHRLATKAWAAQHAPNHPSVHPLRPMDPRTLDADDF